MKRKIPQQFGAVILMAVLLTSCVKELPCTCDGNSTPATVSVFATGLNNPRGLKFGPDGNLYVAEGGTGGTNSTVGQCMQVPPPVGPYTGSPTGGRISSINASGMRTTITDKLPSTTGNPVSGSSISGVSDVAFMGNTLYAMITGAGCSHGVPSIPNGVARINAGGSWSLLANLSEYVHAHPVKNPEEDDYEPDGDFYSMISVGNDFYALEANRGELVRMIPGVAISRVVDISATQGHIVPTALAYHGGNFFVGNLNTFPIVEGSSKVFKITPAGEMTVWASGFTTILGITFDNQNRMYVLETTTGAQFPTPGTGKVIRVNASGAKETIASGLSLPTAITYGPDGNLYVSNMGYGPGSTGGGQVVKISLPICPCDLLKSYANK